MGQGGRGEGKEGRREGEGREGEEGEEDMRAGRGRGKERGNLAPMHWTFLKFGAYDLKCLYFKTLYSTGYVVFVMLFYYFAIRFTCYFFVLACFAVYCFFFANDGDICLFVSYIEHGGTHVYVFHSFFSISS